MAVFDVKSLNAQMDRLKRRNLVGSLALLALLAGIAGGLVYGFIGNTGSAQIRQLRDVCIAIVAIFLAANSYIIVSNYPSKRAGATLIVLNPEELGVEYSNRPAQHIRWADPALNFRMIDYSRVNPKMLAVSSPYVLEVERILSVLTTEAFHAILTEAQTHRVSIREVRNQSWWSSGPGTVLTFGSGVT